MVEDLSTVSGWVAPLAGRYRLDGLLGSGSMADVHRAEDIRLQRAVAIKMFRPDPLAQQRFGEEARVLAQLSHPGLVSIYDAGIDGTQPYLVMQLAQGGSLRSRLLNGPLTPAEAIRLGISLADAIQHMHERGIVHQNIKPANILFDTDSDPHVADPGIAVLIGVAEPANTTEIAYRAPEQLLSTPITPATDIYALGLVLLECLTGKPALPKARNVKSEPMAALLATMTGTNADRRPTAEHCANTLRMLNSRPSVAPLPDRPQAVALALARQRGRRYVVGFGMVAATAAALALTLSPRGPAQSQFPNSAGANQSTSHTVPAQPPAMAPTSQAVVAPDTTRHAPVQVTMVPVVPVASTAAAPDPTPDGSSSRHPTTTTTQPRETATATSTATPTATATAATSDPPAT